MKQFLKPDIKQRVKEDEPLKMKIALGMDKKFRTVERWINEDHIMLTCSTVLATIREHYGMKQSEVLTYAATKAAA